jgi:16S rRNA (adenine1518-N6/adenine1519-N6)-dimethyltransferase
MHTDLLLMTGLFSMATRQTQSYLRSLFEQRGISPQRRLGQNFLIDLNIHDLILKTAEAGPGDVILEIGPGAGALTTLMVKSGAAVVAIDVDPAMAQLTADAVAGYPNVRVLHADALENKNRLNPELLDTIRSGLAAENGKRFKLVANLPYNVATPVIINLLVHPELCPALMIVTIQRELADRLVAEPSSPAYGSVSVIIQALAEVSIVRTLPPTVFWPRPKVESAVVAIRPNAAMRAQTGDVGWFHEIVRRVFLHRRKFLRHAIAGIWRDQWTKTEVDQWLESHGLSGQLRAEAINAEEFRDLAVALHQRWNTIPGFRDRETAETREDETDDVDQDPGDTDEPGEE